MDAIMLLPVVKVVGAILALYGTWWLVGDFVLDRVGIPHVDAAVAWDEVATHEAGDGRAHRYAPSATVHALTRRDRYAGLSRSTGMSRVVRAW
jgi:hypothetical protein